MVSLLSEAITSVAAGIMDHQPVKKNATLLPQTVWHFPFGYLSV
jgi:hypothetical protein